MRTLDEYRRAVAEVLWPLGAFVRVDRGGALFVSDAPARGADMDVRARLERAGFVVSVEAGLMRVTPALDDAPYELRAVCVKWLKADGARAERIAREALAVAMRLHDAASVAYLKPLLEKGE